jgi:TetR/AcrR family transcriptional repressor of nem operon
MPNPTTSPPASPPTPPTRLPRRQPADVRREQILDAAARVLVERGLAATTMAEVAEAASVAKGTVYLYFESKAELLAGLRARYFDDFAARLGEPAAGRPGPGIAARIERLVGASYDFALANHELHHVLFHQAGFAEEDTFARLRTLLAELIETGQADGELEVADPALATELLLHGLHGVLAAGAHRPRFGRRRVVAGVTELASRALGVRAGS